MSDLTPEVVERLGKLHIQITRDRIRSDRDFEDIVNALPALIAAAKERDEWETHCETWAIKYRELSERIDRAIAALRTTGGEG